LERGEETEKKLEEKNKERLFRGEKRSSTSPLGKWEYRNYMRDFSTGFEK